MFLPKSLLSQVSSQLFRSLACPTSLSRPTLLHNLTATSQLKVHDNKTLTVDFKFSNRHLELAYYPHSSESSPVLHSKTLPYVWLRTNCECSQCFNLASAEVEIDLNELDLSGAQQSPAEVKLIKGNDNDALVHVSWPDGHKSEFALGKLAHMLLDEHQLLRKEEKTFWNKEILLKSRTGGLKRVEYEAYLNDDKSLAKALAEIHKYGAVIISGVPAKETEMKRVCSRIGPIQSSYFGTQHCVVSADLAFADRAYTKLALRAHTDTAYMKNCAGLELFHVIRRPADGGGRSLLVDGFYCAEQLRRTSPKEFDFLTRTGVKHVYVKESDQRHMAPTIEIDPRTGDFLQIRFNPYNKVSLAHLTFEEIEFFFRSMQKFSELIRRESNELWLSLNSDEILIFDNFRLLHGRSAFNGERTLVTAYLSRDDWLSMARLLNAFYKKIPKTASNSSSSRVTKQYPNIFGNLNLILYHACITECDPSIEALVNCTGPKFEAFGGISKSLVEACGSKLRKAFEAYLAESGHLNYGVVHATSSYALTNHRYILHVQSPSVHRRYQLVANRLASVVQLTYVSILRTGFDQLDLKSIGLPLIGTGLAGIPLEESMNDLLDALKVFSLSSPSTGTTRSVYLINNDRKMIELMKNFVDEKLMYAVNNNVVNVKTENEDASSTSTVDQSFQSDNEDCVICLEKIETGEAKKLDICGHKFHRSCIEQYFSQSKPVCPICNCVYAIIDGTQPDAGTMQTKVLNKPLAGFDPSVKTIEIVYSIPSGVQTARHPNPGKPYQGCVRTAYLPDSPDGRKVLALLKKAFDHKLIFTIGQSRTSNADNVVTWNDIHHKTSMHGGPTRFGYPDLTYLARVLQELADKGIK